MTDTKGQEEREFDQRLRSALEAHLESELGRTPPALAESLRYSLFAEGKRIRPRLLIACSDMVGLPRGAAFPPAIALEMAHCFTLIHDDLPCMDDDDLRRGKPSNHKVHGEAMALLAGDSLLALAFGVFLDCAPHVSALGFKAGLRRFADAVGPGGVIGGQAFELKLPPDAGLDQIRELHAMKTGALFKASLLVPKDLAEVAAEGDGGQSIIQFADELGYVFQVLDDLEDLGRGQKPPIENVFAHGDRNRILSSCLSDYDRAAKTVHEIWGDSSRELLATAGEVRERLSRAL